MRLLPRGLAARLILGTTVLVAVGHLLSTGLTLGILRGHWMEERAVSADQLSRSLTTATRHLMRAERKDDAYALMRTIGDAQGVVGIRIYNRTGRVTFRTDSGTDLQVPIASPVCQSCHRQSPPIEAATPMERARFVRNGHADSRFELSLVTPIANEPGCSTADCHAHDPGTRVLGVLDLTLDLGPVDGEFSHLRTTAFFLTLLGVVVVAAFLSLVVHRLVARPMRRLLAGTKSVGRMDLERPIQVGSTRELAELASSFNQMQSDLRAAQAENERTLEGLERRVEERSRELQSAREQLVLSDRLASLGRLAASVAHEVNNPISAVLNLSTFLQRILTEQGVPPERLPAFRRHLQQISDETARAGRIVTDLLAFARRAAPQRTRTDLAALVRKTLDIVRHRVTLARVDLLTDLAPDLPPVPCDPSQIEQILLNLVINAVEALKDGGRVVVRARSEAAQDRVALEVEDDGPGIPGSVIGHVFDPFFTTKTEGKGVGLGLSVAYGLAEAHGGSLAVASEPGKRTVFTLRLPLHPVPAETPEEAPA